MIRIFSKFTLLSAFLLTSLLVASCTSGDAPKDKEVVAKVNDRYIDSKTFSSKAAIVAHMPGKDFETMKAKRDLLDEMIREELLFQAAMAEGVVENSERLKREIAREYLNQKVEKKKNPTDEEIKKYYEEHKKELEKIRASHILIKPEDKKSEKSWEKAKKKIEDILAEYRKSPGKETFAKLAKKHSDDKSNAGRGGDLYYFDRSKMVKPFSEVAFALDKIGEVSEPVKTDFGYHLIMLTGEQRGIDFFKQTIKWRIATQHRKDRADQLFIRLKSDANVKVFEDKLASVSVPDLRKMPMHGKQKKTKEPVKKDARKDSSK